MNTSFLKRILLFSVIIACGTVFAQEKILIRGNVISATDKQPLVGASVMELNKDDRVIAAAITNLDGDFSLPISDVKNKLVVSYVGHRKQEIVIGSNRNIKVALEEISTIGEIIVTARQKQRIGSMDIDERDISMAVSRLTAEDFATLQVASIDEAMQGRMAGVDIVANAGDPGSGMTIRIRGTTSINGNNQPLIVIDGIPLETEIGADFDFSTATEEEFSNLLNVAPTDIKDVAVLKDAAATAIWGSKAANGVVQITTIRGSISPPKVSLRVTQTYKPEPRSLPTLSGSEFTTLILEGHINSGIEFDLLRNPEFANDPSNPYYFYNYSQNTDWVKAVSQTGWVQDYTLSVRGGSNKVRYSFSAGYYDDKGNTIETGFQRINAGMRLDYFVSEQLSFQADMTYTHSTTQRNYVPSDNKLDTKSDVRSHAYSKMPNQSIYEWTELGELTGVYLRPINNPQGSYPNVFNPVAMARDGRYDLISDLILPKLSLQYRPSKVWRYTFDVSFQATNNKINKFLPSSATGLNFSDPRQNAASDGDNESFTINTFNKLYFTPQFKDENQHRLIVLLGLNNYDRTSYSLQMSSSNLASPWLQDPSIPSRIYPTGVLEPASGSGKQRTMSTYLNINYTLLDRYTIYGNLNLNGDSRFGKNYRFGLFPAISGRYRVSGEKFMKNIKWLDDFSLRGSWGMSGNAPKYDYMFYNRYATYEWNYLDEAATFPLNLELRELRWEYGYQQNLGFNFVAFGNKLNIEGEVYTKTTKNQFLYNVIIPSNSGFSKMDMNFGTVENRGFELSVNYTVLRNKDWNVNVAFNVARNENRITEISEYQDMYSGSWNVRGNYLGRVELNQPTGSLYGYMYEGVYLNKDQTIARDRKGNKIYTMNESGQVVPVYMQFGYPTISYQFQPGDAKYVDLNNDGNINYQDIVWLGDINPLFTGGITPSIKYKQLTLNSVFHFRYGNSIINVTRMDLEKMFDFSNQSKSVLRRWRQEYENPEDAPDNLLPRALIGKGYNWMGSDRYVEDGSFIRWKSLTLRYNFTRKQIAPLHLSELYIYGTLQNIYVWTNYTGQDPEVSLRGNDAGRDKSRAPVPKMFTLGLNVAF